MSYTIAQPEARDVRDEVLELWQRNLPDASPQRYDWLYERGPASGFVVRTADEAVVGAIGMMRRRMQVFDRTCQVGQPIDLNIDRRHRMGGPAVRLQRRLTEAVDAGELLMAYGLPNAQAEPVLRRAGYRELGRMGRWTKPLRTENLLGRWLKNPLLRGPAAAVVDAALRLRSAETYRRRRRGVRAEIVDRFDSRFDRLWETARQRFAIVGERTADYLQWRFADCPDVRYRTLCLCDDSDRLLAYLVYSQDHGRAYVGDLFFAEPRDLELLLAEFIWLMHRYRKEALTMIYHGHPLIENALRKFGFYCRPSQWKVMVYVKRDEPATATGAEEIDADDSEAMDSVNWFLTRADIDT